jgi:hypothetical protein
VEFHQLRYFCAIADSGGFSRAARLTHVSQPSLSQQIHKLEEELGAQLFDRIGRTVRLTELGRAFLPRARALLSDLEAARSAVAEGSASITGSVCVGVIPTIAPYVLPPLLATFSRSYPQARLTVVEEITPLLLERIRSGAIDVAVVAVPLQTRGHEFQTFPLIEEKHFTQRFPGSTRWPSGGASRSANCMMNLFYCYAMVIVSAKRRWRHVSERGYSRRSFLKADNSAAFSAWCALGWVYRSFRPWRSRNEMAVSSFHSPTAALRG